jgi:ABC-2 type transport system ATP-binding protein
MIKQKETAISVKDLHKSFRLPHEQHSGIKQMIVNLFRKNRKKGYETQHVLKGLNFEIEKGEFYGIVGRNGSGKSTLLKTLAGIYNPEKGAVQIDGTLVPFIELGVGFNPELTGRENVFLNGALLGFSHHEMEVMYKDIIHFAELEKFMDQKLKNYSSGMQVRLAFSIAIRANGDILLLDEVLAVGDEAFQKKCYQYFAELKKNKKTVILVTHDMGAVQQFCNKALMIEKGKIIETGNPAKIAQKYRELFMDQSTKQTKNDNSEKENTYLKLDVRNRILSEEKQIKFDVSIIAKADIDDPVVTFEITRDNGESVYRWVTDEKIKESISLIKNRKTSIELVLDNIFPNGTFDVQVGVKKRDRSKDYILVSEATRFEIINKGSFSGDVRWKPNEKFTLR